jgi:hypothetical protein
MDKTNKKKIDHQLNAEHGAKMRVRVRVKVRVRELGLGLGLGLASI